jgi:hypothetical protein
MGFRGMSKEYEMWHGTITQFLLDKVAELGAMAVFP